MLKTKTYYKCVLKLETFYINYIVYTTKTVAVYIPTGIHIYLNIFNDNVQFLVCDIICIPNVTYITPLFLSEKE